MDQGGFFLKIKILMDQGVFFKKTKNLEDRMRCKAPQFAKNRVQC